MLVSHKNQKLLHKKTFYAKEKKFGELRLEYRSLTYLCG